MCIDAARNLPDQDARSQPEPLVKWRNMDTFSVCWRYPMEYTYINNDSLLIGVSCHYFGNVASSSRGVHATLCYKQLFIELFWMSPCWETVHNWLHLFPAVHLTGTVMTSSKSVEWLGFELGSLSLQRLQAGMQWVTLESCELPKGSGETSLKSRLYQAR